MADAWRRVGELRQELPMTPTISLVAGWYELRCPWLVRSDGTIATMKLGSREQAERVAARLVAERDGVKQDRRKYRLGIAGDRAGHYGRSAK